MKNYLVLISFGFLFLIGCSHPEQLLYDKTYPLTSEKAYSSGTSLNVNIPKGWFTAEDNDSHLIDLWLIEDNFVSQIAFKTVTLHNFDGSLSLKDVASYLKKLKMAELGKEYKEVIPDERFFINAIEFIAYQYLDKQGLQSRTVIFSLNKKYYECLASFSNDANKNKANPAVLFKIQNSVLSSLSIK